VEYVVIAVVAIGALWLYSKRPAAPMGNPVGVGTLPGGSPSGSSGNTPTYSNPVPQGTAAGMAPPPTLAVTSVPPAMAGTAINETTVTMQALHGTSTPATKPASFVVGKIQTIKLPVAISKPTVKASAPLPTAIRRG
jgi:hypothetical protein